MSDKKSGLATPTPTELILTSSGVGTPTVQNKSPAPKKDSKTPAKGQELSLKSVRIDQIGHIRIHNKQPQFCQNNYVFRSYAKSENRNCFKQFHIH